VPSDLVLFKERGYSELLSRPQADRVVLRAGRPIDTTPPDYRELDLLLASGR
jgi:cytosine deaminase